MVTPKGKGRTFICQRPKCGEPFVAGNSLAKYCSAACRTWAGNRMAQERRRDRRTIACRWCGESFTPSYGDRRRVYCTRACKLRQEYKLKPGSTHRRRAKRFGGEYEPVDKLKVFDRDGWRCYICGKPTPQGAQGTRADNAPELDHIIALCFGGPHSYDNVRCACRACNADKGREERRVADAARARGDGG